MPHESSNQSSILGRVGDPEQFSPRLFSGIYSANRLKGPITPLLSKPIASCGDVVTTGSSRPLLDFSEAKTALPERVAYAEATDDQQESDPPKILRSPFEYTQDLVTSRIYPTANISSQRIDPNGPLRSGKSSGYIYFAPTNPSDKTNKASDAHRRVPRRQLSYGDPLSKPGPRSLHKSTGSWELRQEAQRHAEDCNTESRSDSTLNASATNPYLSEPARSKSRVWLDLPEQKHEIQEAVSVPEL